MAGRVPLSGRPVKVAQLFNGHRPVIASQRSANVKHTPVFVKVAQLFNVAAAKLAKSALELVHRQDCLVLRSAL